MASLTNTCLLISSSSSSSCTSSGTYSKSVQAAISVPKLPAIRFPISKTPSKTLQVEEIILKDRLKDTIPTQKNNDSATTSNATAKLYAILEIVADRVEMHKNVGQQRDNWNKLLLNSINMITLTASTMAGVAAATSGAETANILALKVSSVVLFSTTTGMLLIMNKIQPSQLAEEQRNATRLFKQLYREIETTLALYDPTELDVKDAMEKVLALDKAFPLPLLGKMIEKFPKKFHPSVWWPKQQTKTARNDRKWISKDLEEEMRNVVEVIKDKDREDYMRLGNLALKINKILAISGPLLTGIAAAGSAFIGSHSLAAAVAVTAGALASTVNTLEHGGQVGMVVEMYRHCAGFFDLMEESIESTLEEQNFERREDKEMFEMNVALKLGRSLSELKDLARHKSSSCSNIDEFASKLF